MIQPVGNGLKSKFMRMKGIVDSKGIRITPKGESSQAKSGVLVLLPILLAPVPEDRVPRITVVIVQGAS